MPEIHAFRAWRYNPRKVPLLQKVVAPLSDTVLPKLLEQCYEHPHSALHLMHPQSLQAALDKRDAFVQDAIIERDPHPAMYVYEQHFQLLGGQQTHIRRGVLCLVSLKREEIALHEAVFEDKIAMRLAQLKALGMQSVPTHGLINDTENRMESLLAQNQTYPLASVTDTQGTRHIIRLETDLQRIRSLQLIMRQRRLYLADGHHRITTHLRYAEESGEPKAAMHLMFLSNLNAPDLNILPFHRVLQLEGLPSVDEVLPKIERYFTTQPISAREPAALAFRKSEAAIAMVWPKGSLLLHPKPGLPDMVDDGTSREVGSLSFKQLHYFIIDQCFGLPSDKQPADARISYRRSAAAAIKACRDNAQTVSFLMRPASKQQFLDISRQPAVMPPKSTYFYPKVLGGLVFADLA
ncbi:MAG: DUF1015 family protein [Bacteroidota bacterium]